MVEPVHFTAGQVADAAFARVIGALAVRGWTGMLRVEQEGRRYVLFFREGVITAGDSNSPEDTIGRVAIEAGLLDTTAVGESLRKMALSPTKSQRDILIEMGVLAPEALERASRLALSRRAVRVFALPRASYQLEERPHDRLEGGPVEPRWLLYRGLRLHYDERRLEQEMGSLVGQAVKLVADLTEVQEDFGFGDDEKSILVFLQKGFWEVADLVDACGGFERAVVLAVVHALHAFDALDVQPAQTVPRLRRRGRGEPASSRPSIELLPPTIPPASTPPPISHPPTRHSRISAPQPMASTLAPASGGPLPPPLFRPAGGTPAPARPVAPLGHSNAVPSRPATPVGPPKLPSSVSGRAGGANPQSVSLRGTAGAPPVVSGGTGDSIGPTNSTPVKPIGTRATGDFGSRRTPSGRLIPIVAPASVLHALQDQISVKLAAVEANADHFAVLEIDRNATTAQVKAAYFQLAKLYHPDRLPLLKLEARRADVERIFARLSDAFAALSDDKRRQEYLQVLAQGGEAAIKRRADDDAARATRVLTAEEHFRKGEMALRRQMFAVAVEEFREALELNNTEAEHHALFAWAKWCAVPDRQKEAHVAEAKKGLQKALELNKRCVVAFYRLGQIYSAVGDHERAYASFQKVLALEPGHVDAAREVRLHEMRHKSGSGKGLFDRFKKK